MNSNNSKIFASFEDAGIHGVNMRSAQQKLHCPKCHDERTNKRDKSLSVSPQKGTWNCHHCSWAGGIKNENYTPVRKKEYLYPKENTTQISEFWETWFKDRGIEKRVIEYFKLGELTFDNQRWVTFPYYRDQKLINRKSRSEKKDFRLTPGAELIFFNLDAVKNEKEAVVVEGELDSMALYQASVFNNVSVPNGASKGSLKLEYLDNCWDKFEDKERIILFTDNDEPGMVLREELSRRFGRDRCYIVTYPDGCKDANEILTKHGERFLKNVVKTAKPYPIKDVSTPDRYLDEVLEIHRNGYPKGDKIGFTEFDKLMSFRPGEMTVITGIPNSGKSAFLDQILIRLASRFDWRHAVLSREQWPHSIHVSKLTEVFTGKGIDKRDGMTEELIRRANNFLNEHFFLFGIEDLTITGILEKARQLVKQHGIRSLVIDPWNTLDHDTSGFATETDYIKDILKQFVKFKDLYSVHIFLVAHPKKIQKVKVKNEMKYAVPEMYDISGSSHFYNMADNGITAYRNLGTRQSKAYPLGDTITMHVQKVRNKFIGQQGQVTFDYNYVSSTYSEEHYHFINEIDHWLHKVKKEGSEPIPIVFDTPPPPLTDIFKLQNISNFDNESRELKLDGYSPPF